ncbi:variable surface protein [Plasmodium gonderi]|uniref:Variable surface protein n=1 Tax=Plasmodium gonderi TaxID=77519 RepID=A0A1Y1JR78_PLAGO|nr:variable surface protein [Plasmodium gonderi]GAW83988.1 variable surface protein [Plasmodium gonderi]
MDSSIDFNSIYPKCKNEYEEAKNIYRNGTPENTSLGFACRDICQELTGNRGMCGFYIDCLYTGSYLFHIKNNANIKKEESCSYYNYKLNKIFKNFSTTCTNNEQNCYNKITSNRTNVRINIPDICKDHIKKLEQGTYEIFNFMDELYMYLYKIPSGYYICHYREPCVKIYNNLLNKRKILQTQNDSIYNLLDSFSKLYNNYKNHGYYCRRAQNILDSPYERDRMLLQEDESRKKIQERNEKTEKAQDIDQVQEMTSSTVQQVTSELVTQVDTGTLTGITFLIITVATIIFFIYKFTVFGSLLHPRVKKLKKRYKPKSTDHFNLIDSLKISQDLSNHKCQIKYASES